MQLIVRLSVYLLTVVFQAEARYAGIAELAEGLSAQERAQERSPVGGVACRQTNRQVNTMHKHYRREYIDRSTYVYIWHSTACISYC